MPRTLRIPTVTKDVAIRLRQTCMLGTQAQVVNLPKPGKDPEIPQNLRPISLLPSAGKLFQKIILQIVQKHEEGTCLMRVSSASVRVTAQHCNDEASGPRGPNL
jgi:hypothetical protein